MSILPDFTSSALSNLAETKLSKRKLEENGDSQFQKDNNATEQLEETNEEKETDEEREKSNREKFHELIKEKLNLKSKTASTKNSHKKQKQLIVNKYMTALELVFFPELLYETTSKADRFLYKTLYNIQSLNTQTRKRKHYSKRIYALVVKTPDVMILIAEKLIPIILEKDFSSSRFHCFKLLSKTLTLLPSKTLIENGKLLENIWLALIYLALDPNATSNDKPDNNVVDEVSDVLMVESKRVLITLYQTLGFKPIVSLLKPYLEDESMLDSVALTLSLSGLTEPQGLKFIHLLCKSDSWMHRFIGVKTIFYAAQNGLIIDGFFLKEFLECLKLVIADKSIENKIIASLTVNILVPKKEDGYKSFHIFENTVLEELVTQVNKNRGTVLAFQLRALASLVPLMDLELTTIYGKQVLEITKREMNTTSVPMNLTILLSIQKLLESKNFINLEEWKENLFESFFSTFWTRQVSLSGGKISASVLFTTSAIAQKTGIIYVIENLIEHLKDKLESLRVMSVKVITRVLKDCSDKVVTFSESLEERLIDALLIAFQEQKTNTNVFVNCFIILAEKMGPRIKLYLLPIITTGLNLLSNKNQILRRNAAELCASLTHICADLNQTELISKLGAVFYENLGEPIGDVLQHVVKCLAEVFRYTKDPKMLQPPVSQLLPTLTPILKNPHHGVCKNLLDIVGQISSKCSDIIPPREWNRVCNEILEIFKSPVKDIRIQANDTFGIIAEGIGPQEIIITLVNNLKMSERQLRLCSSIAMAIVAKSCGTFTILPILMNEFRTPDTNTKNGILKALAFVFEYTGEDSINYVYHMVPMLEHALTDRNIVLRQTASTVIKSLAVACKSCDREDAFTHFLNLLMPNIFETSPHAIERIRGAIVSIRVTIGTDILMQYIWAGLTHPSTTVREAYFAIYNTVKTEEQERLIPFYPVNNVLELNNVI
ncbi:hypothetical protein QEN19_002547 [Hanseniaspora menglaensis]